MSQYGMGWYPPQDTIPWPGERGRGAGSSVIKGNDGVSAQTLYIFLWLYLSFFKFRLAKKLEKQTKNRYFDVTANFPHLMATDLNRQVEDVITVLKFIFGTQKIVFYLLIFLSGIYYYMHTDW